MTTNSDAIHVEPAYRILNTAVVGLWRRKMLLTSIVAAALVLGLIVVLAMPTRYTAQAYIRGEFFAPPDRVAKEDQVTTSRPMDLDLVRVLETQSRLLLESHLMARRVVEQIGLERLGLITSKPKLGLRSLFGGAAKTPEDEVDIAASTLVQELSVTSDPRAYLLTVRYTAKDPELAQLISNGFVAELLRSTALATLYRQRSWEQSRLSTLLAQLGDKHANVAQAKMRLVATDDLIKEQLSKSEEEILQAAGENVTEAVGLPVSRKSLIGLFLLIGLTISLGVGLWLERATWLVLLNPEFKPSLSQ